METEAWEILTTPIILLPFYPRLTVENESDLTKYFNTDYTHNVFRPTHKKALEEIHC